MSSGFMRSLPTVLTLGRIVAGPVLAALVLWAGANLYADRILAGFIYALTCALFIVAAATDWLDGYIARKYDAVTPLGAALDHCADKVLVACVLTALAYSSFSLELTFAAVLIIGRDIALSGLREGLSAAGRSLPVMSIGKWKAAAEMSGVAVYLAFQATALLFASERLVITLDWSATILIWAAAALALVSGLMYAAAAFGRRDAA